MTTLRSFFALLLFVLAATPAGAHFPWLNVDETGHGLLYFSENPLERNYRVPECIEKAVVTAHAFHGKPKVVALERVEEESYNGRKSKKPLWSAGALTTSIEYGVYHGTMLQYYVKHMELASKAPKQPVGDLKLNATPVRTKHGLGVHVTWAGEPLAGAAVSLTDSKGQQAQKKTNKHGVAKFTSFADGPVGLIIGHGDKEASGKFAGEEYTGESYYMTLTTSYDKRGAEPPAALPELPEPIASFGATVCDDWVYVYSGHTGTQHDHSRNNLSQRFCRLKLDGGKEWEILPMQLPLQGMPIVAHGGKVYRIGGVNSRNVPDEVEDMHSTDQFACYDPTTRLWTSLAPLPKPRSSHDAVVIGDSIYVVGGWMLTGESPGKWHKSALRFDLTEPDKGWQEIAEPPFQRRALALSHRDGKLVVIGGMQAGKGVVSKANEYDPATNKWTDLPDMPGVGFGVSAWNHNGTLYQSGMQGGVFALKPGADKWEKVAKLHEPRFFHRLLTAGPKKLVAIAGASAKEYDHVGTSEIVELP